MPLINLGNLLGDLTNTLKGVLGVSDSEVVINVAPANLINNLGITLDNVLGTGLPSGLVAQLQSTGLLDVAKLQVVLSGNSGTPNLNALDGVLATVTQSDLSSLLSTVFTTNILGQTILRPGGLESLTAQDLQIVQTYVTSIVGSIVNPSPTGPNVQSVTGFVESLLVGNDVVNGDDSDNSLVGGLGNDTINGLGGNDTLNGETGNDSLSGGTGNDSLIGGIGDDTLDGGTGADTMLGGLGNDTFIVDNAGDVVTEGLGEGIDTVLSSIDYTLGANVENLTLTGSAAINGTGNALDNLITGNAGNNVLDGGAGADTLIGGGGDDTYVVDNAGDVVTEASGGGTDTVRSSVSYALGANVENLTLTGSAAINATGNGLTGNGGDNVLNGGGGEDTMAGGGGDDSYYVDDAGDVLIEGANAGTDTVYSSIDYTLGDNFENLVLTGSNATDGTGNELDNLITGNSAANTLTGLAGDDTLIGGGGADTLVGGLGDDTYVTDGSVTITEAANAGNDTVESSATYKLGANVENLKLTGTDAINWTGNTLDSVITGNAAENVLKGGGGADKINGGGGGDRLTGSGGDDKIKGGDGDDRLNGGGDDTLIGGGGADTFVFDGKLSADNSDVISTFQRDDVIELDRSMFHGLKAGPLNDNAFYVGAHAHDASDRIIYNAKTGALFYDPDGTGSKAAVQFATIDSLDKHLTVDDFKIV